MTDEPRLEPIGRAHSEALVEMAREFHAEGDPRLDPVLADIDAFFDRTQRFRLGQGLPEDRVQQTHYLLFAGPRLLGGARLRHRLIPPLLLDGGNIGYEIRKSERGKGYGTHILALMLAEARRIGLERVFLTAAHANVASRRTIERNGGVPAGESISPITGERMARYWIRL